MKLQYKLLLMLVIFFGFTMILNNNCFASMEYNDPKFLNLPNDYSDYKYHCIIYRPESNSYRLFMSTTKGIITTDTYYGSVYNSYPHDYTVDYGIYFMHGKTKLYNYSPTSSWTLNSEFDYSSNPTGFFYMILHRYPADMFLFSDHEILNEDDNNTIFYSNNSFNDFYNHLISNS